MSLFLRKLLKGVGAWLVPAALAWAAGAETPPGQAQDDFGFVQSISVRDLRLTLRHTNTFINKWFILDVQGPASRRAFHLENRDANQKLSLGEQGLVLDAGDGSRVNCALWNNTEFDLLKVKLEAYNQTFYPLCGDRLYIRLSRGISAAQSATEWATELLRQTRFGEGLISAIKPYVVQFDAEKGDSTLRSDHAQYQAKANGPAPALVDSYHAKGLVSVGNQLGYKLAQGRSDDIEFGSWYPVAMHEGIYTSLFKPELIAKDIFASHKDRVQLLKAEELDKLVYMTAYDLSRFTINYAVGVKHPEINTRAPSLQAPWRHSLVPIGSIPPYELRNAVSVFVGGFKNRHGVFSRAGSKFEGRTYGYIESGVVLEPMSADLATIYVTTEGQVHIEPWPATPAEQLKLRQTVVGARQNGLLLIDKGEPGPYVGDWFNGNWSADVNGLVRSLRSGVCLQEQDNKRYLIFMAFTSATPSSMARVMQAYRCHMAMHLDMNAFMYLHNAIYTWDTQRGFTVEYLHKEMLWPKDTKVHRFIMENNERDFFYVKRK